jgi:RNA polymerase sigma factor (sigma-70 family)
MDHPRPDHHAADLPGGRPGDPRGGPPGHPSGGPPPPATATLPAPGDPSPAATVTLPGAPEPPPEPPAPPRIDFAALLRQNRPSLKSLFRDYGVPSADAEDILQQALLVLVLQQPHIDHPPAFLLGTVRHRIQLYLQRCRTERAALDELARLAALAADDVPQARIDSQEDARRLLARLPAPARRIVALRHGAGVPSRELARSLERSETGVRQIASRGLRFLRRYAKR